jgi:hypothetical protein
MIFSFIQIRVDPDLLSDLAIVNAKHLSSKQRNLFAVRRRLELQLQRLEQAASGLLSVDAGTQVESKSVLEGLKYVALLVFCKITSHICFLHFSKQREEIQPKLVEVLPHYLNNVIHVCCLFRSTQRSR